MEGTPTHDLRRAPYRTYQVLAALRLAMLIRIIRKRHPQDAAINVVAHSMGCTGVPAGTWPSCWMEGGVLRIALVLRQPAPRASTRTHLDDASLPGPEPDQPGAGRDPEEDREGFPWPMRRNPGWVEIQQAGDGGLAWKLWAKGQKKHPHSGEPISHAERDNRGRVHLYFTPHDRTVALLNTQGIGWKGVPDT